MFLGESAGIIAAQAITDNSIVQAVNVTLVQQALAERGVRVHV